MSLRPLICVVALLLAGCATTTLQLSEEDYAAEIQRLQSRLAQDPDDAEALRDLGVLYLRTETVGRGVEFLKQAFSRDASDPKTRYYLGLANETLQKPDTALSLYEAWADVPASSPYRARLQGRFQRLTRQLAQAELRTRIATEDSLRTAGVAEARAPSPNVVAVYPFTFLGGNRQFESLGRGLAELISADLVHLPGITVIERARMQDLLAELNLSNEEFMDPSSTPRVGRLLTAGRIVGGGFSVPGDQVQLDAAIMNASPNTVQDLGTRTDDLNRLFELQDELVFAIADSLNIDLTPQQREQISFIPTGNLEAFLAFSRGLEREDAGDFSGAASLYQQAAQLDPAFTQASSGQVRAQNTAQVPEGTGAALSDAFSLETPLSPTIDPVADRIEQLNGVLDLTVVPSDDTREPAAESVPVELPLPPNPPGRPPGGN